MSEEEIIKTLQERVDFCKNNTECREELKECFGCSFEVEEIEAIETLLNLYNKEKEKNEKLNNLIYTKLKLNIIENGMRQIDYINKNKIKEKITYYEELIKTNPEDEEILRHIIQALNEILEESE